MSNTKKPAFNADAAEEYFSDLLFYYKKTGDDIFNRDNEGRHTTNFIYSAEYQKYVGMQIAMREVLEYFSKYDLADVQEILGEDYDLDRLRELAQADREGRCVVLPAGGFSDQDGENALKSAMNTCYYHNNPVTRFIADAVAEKLVRSEAALKERENNG